jgi:predicted MFS family arabinose efflux permease
MILQQCIIVFITQIVFIGCRTWNVSAIARKDVKGVLISGALVHIAWLISIAIGAVSMHKIVNDFDWQYLPIVICSLIGGLLGSYWGMKNKK